MLCGHHAGKDIFSSDIKTVLFLLSDAFESNGNRREWKLSVKTLDRFESYQVFVSAINRWCFHDRR